MLCIKASGVGFDFNEPGSKSLSYLPQCDPFTNQRAEYPSYCRAKKALVVISSTVPSPAIFRYCGAAIAGSTTVLFAHEE